MSYDFKVEMERFGDITSKVSSFQITDNILQFARQATVNISDPIIYASLDFSVVTAEPEITISTKIHDTWEKQGDFFIERPSLVYTKDNTRLDGVWGRSITAKLAMPFAGKVNKIWEDETSFFDICEEMCDLVGLTWDSNHSEVDNYKISPSMYSVEYVYPIDVLMELASFVGGTIATDKDGNVRVVKYKYTLSNSLWTITDNQIQSLTERPTWPEFGNRVRISPIGGLSGYMMVMYFPDGQCIAADGETSRRIMVQVLDAYGSGVNNVIVDWEHNGEHSTFTRGDKTITQQVMVTNELGVTTSSTKIDLGLPPVELIDLYSVDDTAKTKNYAEGGLGVAYSIDGREVALSGEEFPYCDDLMSSNYLSDGCTYNSVLSGTTPEDITVTASVKGSEVKGKVYIGNDCECPTLIRLTPYPSSLYQGEVSHLLVYLEESGPVKVARHVYMSAGVRSYRKGALEWNTGFLSQVRIQYEVSLILNDVPGSSTIELTMYPAALDSPAVGNGVVSVYPDDGTGNPDFTLNYYASRSGKTITLNVKLPTGRTVYVDYEAQGAILNRYFGNCIGDEDIHAAVKGRRREPFTATITMQIQGATECDPTNTDDDIIPNSGLFTVPVRSLSDPSPNPVFFRPWYQGDAVSTPIALAFDVDEEVPEDELREECLLLEPEFPEIEIVFPRVLEVNRRAGCTLEDIQCVLLEYCCKTDEEAGYDRLGCNDVEDCTAVPSECCNYLELLPDPRNLIAQRRRFEEAIEAGCEPDELCSLELIRFGTTQNFDGGSMRPISTIAFETHQLFPGTEENHEMQDTLRQQALEECIAQTQCRGNIVYTTLEMEPSEEQLLTIDTASPDATRYTWELTRGGGTLSTNAEGAPEPESGIYRGIVVYYTAPSSNANCVDNPTITLLCDERVQDEIEMTINNSTYNPTVTAYIIIEEINHVLNPHPQGECWLSAIEWANQYSNCPTGDPGGFCIFGPPYEVLVRGTRDYNCGGTILDCGGDIDKHPVCADINQGESTAHPCEAAVGLTDFRDELAKTNGCCPEALL